MNKLWALIVLLEVITGAILLNKGVMVFGIGFLMMAFGTFIGYLMGVEATFKRLKK